MAVSPNTTCKDFCVWMQATAWLEITTPQNSIITTVYTAANAGTTVTDNVWNNFLRTTGLWYQYYTAYLAQTVNSASLPANIVQGDLIYGSAANTLSRLAKSGTSNSFLKNSGASNNPAWSTIATSDLSDTSAWTQYTPTVTGYAGTPTVVCYWKYISVQTIVMQFYISGTSNGTGLTFPLPAGLVAINITNMFQFQYGLYGIDNSGLTNLGFLSSTPNSATLTFFFGAPTANWTNANIKRIAGTIIMRVQ